MLSLLNSTFPFYSPLPDSTRLLSHSTNTHLPRCSLVFQKWLFASWNSLFLSHRQVTKSRHWHNALSNNLLRLPRSLAVFTADFPCLETRDFSSIKRFNSVLMLFSNCVRILAWFLRSTSRWLDIGRTTLFEMYLSCFKDTTCFATYPRVGSWDEESSHSGGQNIE